MSHIFSCLNKGFVDSRNFRMSLSELFFFLSIILHKNKCAIHAKCLVLGVDHDLMPYHYIGNLLCM